MRQTSYKRLLGAAAMIVVAVWGTGGTAAGGTFTGLGPAEGTWFVSAAFHPTDPNTIYFGMDDGGGVYKSTDGGLSVQYISGSLPNVSGWAIAIDAANPNRIWVGDFYGRGVYQSFDGGATWAFYNSGLTASPPYYGRMIDALVFDPSTTGRLLAYTHDGLYTLDTTIANSSWVKRAKPPDVPALKPDATPDTSDLLRMAVHRSGRLFVGGSLGKLYTAADATQTWTLQATFAPESIANLDIDPVSGDLFVTTVTANGFANVRRSSDFGVSWTPVLMNELSFAVGEFAVRGSAMYFATFGQGSAGVKRSLDNGRTWETIGNGIDKPFAISLEINPLNTSQLFLGTAGNAYRTSNATAPAATVTWTKSNYGLKYTSVHYDLADPTNPSHLFVTDVGLIDLPGLGGIYQSNDAGATWSLMPGYTWSAWSLAMDPGNPQVLLAGTWTQGVKRSTNGGITWSGTGLSSGLVYKLAFGGSSQVAFGAVYDRGLYKSTDGGVTWAQELSLTLCDDVLIDPGNPNTVYTAGQNGAWKSTDAGQTWSNLGPNFTSGSSLARDPQNPQKVYLGTWSGALWSSTNGGSNWARIDPSWQGQVASVIAASPSTIYVALYTQDRLPVYFAAMTPGYFRSNDGGVSWVNLSADQRPVTSVSYATGAPDNTKKSYLTLNGVQGYLSGDLFNYPPSSTTILQGILRSGSYANLAASDGSYYVINSSTSGTTSYTDWFGSAAVSQAPSSIATLALTYEGKYSRSGRTQTLHLYNWSSAAWTQINSGTVGTSNVRITSLQKSSANFISPTGQIQLRVQGSGNDGLAFRSLGDYMLFTVETAPGVFKQANVLNQGADSEAESVETTAPFYKDDEESHSPFDPREVIHSALARVILRHLSRSR